MSTARIHLDEILQPFKAQKKFIYSNALFTLWAGGVGSGKSHALAGWVLRRALMNPKSIGALLGRTSRDLLLLTEEKLFPMVTEIQRQTGVCLIREHDRGNARIRLINDTWIYLRPFNRTSKIRGMTLAFAGVDEADHSEADPDELWSVLTGRMRGNGPCPGLAFATSPNGLRGIVKRFVDARHKYELALAKGDLDGIREGMNYFMVKATSFDNPHNPPHFFDSLRSMSKRRYEQEVLGRVLAPLNTVLNLEDRHLIDWDWRQHKLPWVLGVDWGGQDHHVALMIQIDRPNGRYVVADELIGDGMPRGKFQDMLSKWITSKGSEPVVAGVDRAAPGENTILQTRLRNTPITWMSSRNEQKVTTGLEYIRDLMDPQDDKPKLVLSKSLATVTTGPTAPLIPALRGYVYEMADGTPTMKPDKDNIHDHMPDCLRYALMASKDNPSGRLK